MEGGRPPESRIWKSGQFDRGHNLPIFGTLKTNALSINIQSRFATVAIDGVLRGAGTHFTAVAAQQDLLGTLGLSV